MSHFYVAAITKEEPYGESELERLLEPYDENKKVEPYIYKTKAQIIEDGKAWLESCKKRKEEDPDRYKEYESESWYQNYINAKTDEDFYNAEVVGSGYNRFDSEGNYLSTYNPDSKWDWWVIGGRWADALDDDYMPIGEYKKIMSKDNMPWAYVDETGWHERGKMGWWAMNDATEESEATFEKEFEDMINSISEDYYITCIDCHI